MGDDAIAGAGAPRRDAESGGTRESWEEGRAERPAPAARAPRAPAGAQLGVAPPPGSLGAPAGCGPQAPPPAEIPRRGVEGAGCRVRPQTPGKPHPASWSGQGRQRDNCRPALGLFT